MTEDKNFVKNELCLRLFSSRRQPPLLVPHCLGRSVSRLILLKSKIVYTNNITKCGVYWEFLHLCHKLVLLVHICDPAFRRTKKTHVHPRTSHVHPRASHVHPAALKIRWLFAFVFCFFVLFFFVFFFQRAIQLLTDRNCMKSIIHLLFLILDSLIKPML